MRQARPVFKTAVERRSLKAKLRQLKQAFVELNAQLSFTRVKYYTQRVEDDAYIKETKMYRNISVPAPAGNQKYNSSSSPLFRKWS